MRRNDWNDLTSVWHWHIRSHGKIPFVSFGLSSNDWGISRSQDAVAGIYSTKKEECHMSPSLIRPILVLSESLALANRLQLTQLHLRALKLQKGRRRIPSWCMARDNHLALALFLSCLVLSCLVLFAALYSHEQSLLPRYHARYPPTSSAPFLINLRHYILPPLPWSSFFLSGENNLLYN